MTGDQKSEQAGERWQVARLIPTSGINGAEEQERRAVSALLAVVSAVREFGVGLTRPLGAPAGPIEAFIEVPFKHGDQVVRPDGILRVVRGQRTWVALIEVKTGTNLLEKAQVEAYLDVAREQGFDCVLTISNEIAPNAGVHPVEVDKRKLRKVALHHISWAQILGDAVMQRVHRGVNDPDQAWILAELIRYLEHPKSGALDFNDMGTSWVAVRDAVSAGTLRTTDKGLAEVVSRWEALLRFASVRLSRELGADVQVVVSRPEAAEPARRAAAVAEGLVASGALTGALRVPNVVGPIRISADLRTNRLVTAIDVDAPQEGRPTTRVNWLVRQLGDARPDTRIDASARHSRATASCLLSQAIGDPTLLIDDPARELRQFTISQSRPLGTKRGTGRGAFIDSVIAAIDEFYVDVAQRLRPWAPKAPKKPANADEALLQAGVDTTPDLEGTAG